MARIRQINPNNYRTSPNISAEFESLVRYLQAAERGDKTIGELLAILFDSDGAFAGPVEMRYDSTNGLQYRVGEYDDSAEGWLDLVDVADLRGPAGVSLGTIEGEIFHNRQTFVATAGQTVFSYDWEATGETPMVFQQGLLLTEDDDYTIDQAAGEITLASGATLNDVITVLTVRTGAVTNYRRSDQEATAGQAVFAFVHTSEETVLVYKNGLLQRYGGAYDYTNDPDADTITFTAGLTGGDKVSIIVVENLAISNVTGLMLESAYTNGSGLIPYSKLSIADGDIPQAKIAGLTAALTTKGKMFVSGTTPTGMVAGDLWLDTSVTPNVLKVYDGSDWLDVDATGGVPDFDVTDANRYLRVNGTGTAVEFGVLDLSSRIPVTYMGAADGVATLDSSGFLPTSQLPEIFGTQTLPFFQSGVLANATYDMQYIFKQKVRIDGIVRILGTGSCDVEITVNGTVVSSVYGGTTTVAQSTLGTPIEVDGTSTAKLLGIKVTNVAGSAADLRIGLAVAALTA